MLELIIAGLIYAVAAAVYTVVVLLLSAVIDWFIGEQDLIDDDSLRFTIKQNLEEGTVRVVQGIFDTSTDQVKKYRPIKAERLDEELTDYHEDDELVVYN